jgi:catechol-2,3-dioxygenase
VRTGRTRPRCAFTAATSGKLTHHDVALVESPNLPAPAEWVLSDGRVAINHVALTMANREAWLKQLAFLQSRGVKFNWRVNHGVTHSVYINDPNGYGVEFLYELPREMWEGDIDGAVNWAEQLPSEGPEALVDRTDTPSFGKPQAAAVPAE